MYIKINSMINNNYCNQLFYVPVERICGHMAFRGFRSGMTPLTVSVIRWRTLHWEPSFSFAQRSLGTAANLCSFLVQVLATSRSSGTCGILVLFFSGDSWWRALGHKIMPPAQLPVPHLTHDTNRPRAGTNQSVWASSVSTNAPLPGVLAGCRGNRCSSGKTILQLIVAGCIRIVDLDSNCHSGAQAMVTKWLSARCLIIFPNNFLQQQA